MVKSEISWAFSKLLFFTWQPASPLSLPWKLKKKKKNGRTNSWDIKPARWGIQRGSFHSLVFFFFFLIYVVRNKIIKKKKSGRISYLSREGKYISGRCIYCFTEPVVSHNLNGAVNVRCNTNSDVIPVVWRNAHKPLTLRFVH